MRIGENRSIFYKKNNNKLVRKFLFGLKNSTQFEKFQLV